MGYDSNVLRRATARLEDGKKRRQEEVNRRTRDAYALSPRLAEIDRELRGTIVGIVSAALRNGTCPRTLWTTSLPAPSAETAAGWATGCATA